MTEAGSTGAGTPQQAELTAITKAYDLVRDMTRRVGKASRDFRFLLGDLMLPHRTPPDTASTMGTVVFAWVCGWESRRVPSTDGLRSRSCRAEHHLAQTHAEIGVARLAPRVRRHHDLAIARHRLGLDLLPQFLAGLGQATILGGAHQQMRPARLDVLARGAHQEYLRCCRAICLRLTAHACGRRKRRSVLARANAAMVSNGCWRTSAMAAAA